MGSTTSKIAQSSAVDHLLVGPIVLLITFLLNIFFNMINGIDIFKPTGATIVIGAFLFFFINWYVAATITVPNAVKTKCGKTVPTSQRIWHGLWPAFMSLIGDPNIIAMITYGTPLIILAPIIITLLPIGPLTLGITMLLRQYLAKVPILGTVLAFFPVTRIFDLLTSSWLFIIPLFLIGYNFWSWIGGVIAATRAMNQTCK